MRLRISDATALSTPIGITSGPDGALWFTEYAAGRIGRITTGGVFTEYKLPAPSSGPFGIVSGPDGALWFAMAAASKIGRIATNGDIKDFAVVTGTRSVEAIAAGPDGALWYTSGKKLSRISTLGVIKDFEVGTAIDVVTGTTGFGIGPDGALWYPELALNTIGRAVVAPAISESLVSNRATPDNPLGIARGPDGAMWFTDSGSNRIGRITPGGATNEYTVPSSNVQPYSITRGPDDAMWFTEFVGNKIGRINSSTGVITEYAGLTANSQPAFIAKGPDGALWFTEYGANQIGRIDSGTGKVTEYPIPTPQSFPHGIAAGADGSLWFVEIKGNNIGRINPATGKITEFKVPTSTAQPYAIAAGVDGNLWFTEYNAETIGQISTHGTFLHEFRLPGAATITPTGIASGPDGALWFVEKIGNKLGRISTSGLIDEFPIATAGSQPFDIAAGPDGAMWFAEYASGKIGRAVIALSPTITSVNTAGAGTDIGQNTWIEIKGGNLVPANSLPDGVIWNTAPSFSVGQMPTKIGGVSVTVNGKPAFVYFYCSALTSPVCQQDQINVLTPLDSTLGSVGIVVTNGFTSTPPFPATTKNVVPSLLLFSPKGYVVATHANNTLLGPATLYPGFSTPAKAGETVVLYGVGFGLPTGPLVNSSSSQSGLLPAVPSCQVGGQNAPVGFAGLISPGLYQLNVTIPAAATSGDKSIVCSYNSSTTPSGDLITVQ